MKRKSITTFTLLAIFLIITITSTFATRHIHPQNHVIEKTKKPGSGEVGNNGTNIGGGPKMKKPGSGEVGDNGTNNGGGSTNKRPGSGAGRNNGKDHGGGPFGGFFGPGGGFNIPGLGGGVYGGGFGGPIGGFGKGGVISANVVCKEKGPCLGKKLICPAKCYKSYSSAGKGYGFGGGSGGCTMDCKKKCVAYC